MAKSTADPLNFPTDEIQSRLEFINTQYSHIIKECRELQKKLSYRESITDEKEKELLDEADIAFEKFLINLIDSKFYNR